MDTHIMEAANLIDMHEKFGFAIQVVTNEIVFWHRLNVALQLSSIALGIAATLFMALHNERNKRWAKPLGIVATTLVTGIATVYSVFHIRENVDKMLDIQLEFVHHSNELDHYIRENLGSAEDHLQTEKKYAAIFNRLGNERRRTMGSYGRPTRSFSQEPNYVVARSRSDP